LEFEIVVGAVLTQNTSWKNAERGLASLKDIGLTSAPALSEYPTPRLEQALQPVGFFRKKSRLLKRLSEMILNHPKGFYSFATRNELLSIKGIGPETADAILLYACAKPEFVADNYSRRILERLGLPVGEGYGETKDFIESHLPSDVELFRRFHALLVEHAKYSCRKVPLCSGCVLQRGCDWVCDS
jgi:endonuclease-3 related protein